MKASSTLPNGPKSQRAGPKRESVRESRYNRVGPTLRRALCHIQRRVSGVVVPRHSEPRLAEGAHPFRAVPALPGVGAVTAVCGVTLADAVAGAAELPGAGGDGDLVVTAVTWSYPEREGGLREGKSGEERGRAGKRGEERVREGRSLERGRVREREECVYSCVRERGGGGQGSDL